ncbi:MAG: hypothetical protein ABS46_09615 [Cytophagaceae bacterium SCN 52-12]|nr:MAG: hypothetical protein ABS46_09615 [Cytophagaceae bacterium SCN 52-12]
MTTAPAKFPVAAALATALLVQRAPERGMDVGVMTKGQTGVYGVESCPGAVSEYELTNVPVMAVFPLPGQEEPVRRSWRAFRDLRC